MRIMIADDAGFIREIIRNVYIQQGHQIVAESANGPDTITFALQSKPELLILDLVLPGLNGLEVAVEIRSHNPDIVIVVTSSLDKSKIASQAEEAGAIYFMQKPFSKAELLHVIDLVHERQERKLKYG